MRIFIRADGGKVIGIGHIMRMIVLAKELEKTNEVIFICKKDNCGTFDAGIEILKLNNLSVEYIAEEGNVNEIIRLQEKYDVDCIITDSYDVDKEYFNILKQNFKLSGYVDDVNKCYMNVDFIINQNINALDIDYSNTTNKKTKLFLGTKYCLLRDEFISACKKKKQKEQGQDILLTLGGMDDNKNTLKLLKSLETIQKNIHVVIGNAYPKDLIKKLYMLYKTNNNIRLYENANMPELMYKCDMAISGCGSTIYELCAMKVPSIGIIIANNQIDAARKMRENRMVADIFDFESFNEEKFKDSVYRLIDNSYFRKSVTENQKGAVNILGKYELVNEINELIN